MNTMNVKLADLIMKDFLKKNGPHLSLNEVLSMQTVISDAVEMYALQKGDVTFLAWVRPHDTLYPVITKTVCW